MKKEKTIYAVICRRTGYDENGYEVVRQDAFSKLEDAEKCMKKLQDDCDIDKTRESMPFSGDELTEFEDKLNEVQSEEFLGYEEIADRMEEEYGYDHNDVLDYFQTLDRIDELEEYGYEFEVIELTLK